MSWHLGGIFLKTNNDSHLLDELGCERNPSSAIDFDTASSSASSTPTIAECKGWSVILDPTFRLPGKLLGSPNSESSFDKRLQELSTSGVILAFVLEGFTETLACVHYQDGQRLLRFLSRDSTVLIRDTGSEEETFFDEVDQDRIIEYLERYGAPVEDIGDCVFTSLQVR